MHLKIRLEHLSSPIWDRPSPGFAEGFIFMKNFILAINLKEQHFKHQHVKEMHFKIRLEHLSSPFRDRPSPGFAPDEDMSDAQLGDTEINQSSPSLSSSSELSSLVVIITRIKVFGPTIVKCSKGFYSLKTFWKDVIWRILYPLTSSHRPLQVLWHLADCPTQLTSICSLLLLGSLSACSQQREATS